MRSSALTATTAADYATLILRRALEGGRVLEGEQTADLAELGRKLREREVDLDEVLRHVVDAAAARLRADRGTLYLVDRARQEVVSRVAHLPEIQEIRLKLGEGIAGSVAQRGQALRLPSAEADPRFTPRVDQLTGYQTRSLLAVPLRSAEGPIIGVLQLLNKQGGSFDAEDAQKLAALAEEVAALLEASSLRSQLCAQPRQPLSFRFNNIVGESAAMQKVYELTTRAARTDATVLLRGESGAGKELIARAVHYNSGRREQPFVVVDCAALPAELIENELFGHERGAYTSADRASPGKVETADRGTLFLDEVGELPLPVQARLLRLAQERTFFRVGGSRPLQVDVRFVCATHRNLEDMVKEGRFRADLYYRLRVVQIPIPPLRERGHGDLDRLIDHFLFEFLRRHGRPRLRLSTAARAALHAYEWPGNVRELQHCIESAVVLAPGEEITPELLPVAAPAAGEEPQERFSCALKPLEEVEREYVAYAVRRLGSRSAAARALGIGRNTLARKLGS